MIEELRSVAEAPSPIRKMDRHTKSRIEIPYDCGSEVREEHAICQIRLLKNNSREKVGLMRKNPQELQYTI